MVVIGTALMKSESVKSDGRNQHFEDRNGNFAYRFYPGCGEKESQLILRSSCSLTRKLKQLVTSPGKVAGNEVCVDTLKNLHFF